MTPRCFRHSNSCTYLFTRFALYWKTIHISLIIEILIICTAIKKRLTLRAKHCFTISLRRIMGLCASEAAESGRRIRRCTLVLGETGVSVFNLFAYIYIVGLLFVESRNQHVSLIFSLVQSAKVNIQR